MIGKSSCGGPGFLLSVGSRERELLTTGCFLVTVAFLHRTQHTEERKEENTSNSFYSNTRTVLPAVVPGVWEGSHTTDRALPGSRIDCRVVSIYKKQKLSLGASSSLLQPPSE